MEIMIHPRVEKYLNKTGEKERLLEHIKLLAEDPYTPRSGVDIIKMEGKKHTMYRLKVGDHRFEYFINEGMIWLDEAFRRGRGYRDR